MSNNNSGKVEVTSKQLDDLKHVHEIQGTNGTWDYDPYMHGMYNGIEMMLSIVENREPKFREAPKQWLVDIPMPKSSGGDRIRTLKNTKLDQLSKEIE